MKYLICTALLVTFSGAAFAQVKTVTNADLEQYRQKRLAAEKEYRENYEALGFPSPEERDRQIEESKKENAARAAEYRRLRLERELIESYSQPAQTNYFYQQNTSRPGYTRYYGFTGSYYPYTRINRHRSVRTPGPGHISNPLIRSAWQRQSRSMRETYRGNLYRPKARPRN